MRESMLTNGLIISNFSGGAPAEEGDWDPISPQASKHSQALWILLWRDQVSVRFLKIEMYIVHIKHVNISFFVQDLSHSWVCSSRRDVQVSAEATQAKVSEAARQRLCYISKRANPCCTLLNVYWVDCYVTHPLWLLLPLQLPLHLLPHLHLQPTEAPPDPHSLPLAASHT